MASTRISNMELSPTASLVSDDISAVRFAEHRPVTARVDVKATAAPSSFRSEEEKITRLDAVAESLGRNRNWCINEAIDNYLELHTWQLAQIEQGIADSDTGRTFGTQDVREHLAAHHQIRLAKQSQVSRTLRWSAKADVNLRQIYDYVASERYSLEAARQVVARITETCST